MKFKKFIYLLAGILTVSGLFAGCSVQQTSSSELIHTHQLTIGMTGDFPPYSYRSHGKLTGYEVSVAKAVANQLHLKSHFVATKWDSLLAGLGSQRYDAVLNDISSVKGTNKVKHFSSSIPYMYSRSVLITSSHNHTIKNLHNIKGKEFAEGIGTGNEKIARKFGAQIVPSNEFKTTISLIKEGRVQGNINSFETWYGFAKSHSTKGLRAYVVPNSQYPADRIAILFGKRSPKLRKRINKALRKLKANGTLAHLSKEYFGRNDTINQNFSGVLKNKQKGKSL